MTDLPSLQQARIARKLICAGEPMPRIMKYFSGAYDEATIRAGIERLRADNRARSQIDRKHKWRDVVAFEPVKSIPAAVLADRDRRASLKPASITAARFGDPLPGYSALERAPSIAPEQQRDPLAYLIFRRGRTNPKTGARFG